LFFFVSSLNWIHSDDAVSVEKSLVEIEDYLQTKTKIETIENEQFRWAQKFDAFNVKMILIGSAAMAFSMLSGNFLFGCLKLFKIYI